MYEMDSRGNTERRGDTQVLTTNRKPFDMLANGVDYLKRRPFVEEFRIFCLSCPGVKDTVWGLDNTLQELLSVV
jgi:hypothetical protein